MMECEICGAEYPNTRAMAQHKRLKHPGGLNTIQPKPVNNMVPNVRTANEIISEYLDTKLKLRLAKDIEHLDDTALSSLATGQPLDKKDPMKELKESLALMTELRAAFPDSQQIGKTWPDVLVESLPSVLEGIKGINEQKRSKRDHKPDQVLDQTDLEKEIIRKEEALKNGNSIKSESANGNKHDEGVSAEDPLKAAGNNRETEHIDPGFPEGG